MPTGGFQALVNAASAFEKNQRPFSHLYYVNEILRAKWRGCYGDCVRPKSYFLFSIAFTMLLFPAWLQEEGLGRRLPAKSPLSIFWKASAAAAGGRGGFQKSRKPKRLSRAAGELLPAVELLGAAAELLAAAASCWRRRRAAGDGGGAADKLLQTADKLLQIPDNVLLPETQQKACGWGCFTTWEGRWWRRKGLKTGQRLKGFKMLTFRWKQLCKDPKMKQTKKPWGGGQG
jgi:hypothetical protein